MSSCRPAITVVLPSYGRPKFLNDCLQDLMAQECACAYEVLAVARTSDQATLGVVKSFQPRGVGMDLRLVAVEVPGFVAALRAGFLAARGDVIAFCDDDARYPVDWLQRIIHTLSANSVGAVGGPIEEGQQRASKTDRNVARVSWYGKTHQHVRGRHPFTQPVEVDFLCGANMAFRREALALDDFDLRLDGSGYSPGNELAICFNVRKRGYSVLYDPQLSVQHLRAPWVDSSRGITPHQIEIYSRNTSYLMRRTLSPMGKAAFLCYFWLVGQQNSPGLLLGVLGLLTRKAPFAGWMRVAMKGKREGWAMAGLTH